MHWSLTAAGLTALDDASGVLLPADLSLRACSALFSTSWISCQQKQWKRVKLRARPPLTTDCMSVEKRSEGMRNPLDLHLLRL